ncbi:LAFA_0E10418g1_1 [Lachancea sp. 'fantastica']|nr:LAFA_0E10418g1_1 [Lachancea sp. 'fantastica']
MNSASGSHLSSASLQDKKTGDATANGVPSGPLVRTLPRQTDQIEATPNVDYQDRLWTQIDVLDDVRRMAREKDTSDGFPAGFEPQLKQLREAHVKLLNTMKTRRDKQELREDGEQNGDEKEDYEEQMKLVSDVTRCVRGLRD